MSPQITPNNIPLPFREPTFGVNFRRWYRLGYQRA
jgi:hypothetical protein